MHKNKTSSSINVMAMEALEGAVCYLQQQLAPKNITLSDEEAQRIIAEAANTRIVFETEA